MSAPFIKLLRGPDTEKMLAEHPNCFLVLTLIALRARREAGGFNPHELQIGEALVGDFAAAGLERQPFRTALANLQRWGIITTRATSKGTIAKLSDTGLYDINSTESNHQPNQQSTNNLTSNQPTANQQLTTNKNVKNIKNEKEEERKDVGQPASQPVFASQEEKKEAQPATVKLWPDEAVVFTISGFAAFVSKMSFGHIDKGMYLPDIQRRADLMQQQRDETGWENFIHEFLKREVRDRKLVTLEMPAASGEPARASYGPAPTIVNQPGDSYDLKKLAVSQLIPTH